MKIFAGLLFLASVAAIAEDTKSPFDKSKESIESDVKYQSEKYAKDFGGPIIFKMDWDGYKKFCTGYWGAKSECNGSNIIGGFGRVVENMRSTQKKCGGPLTDKARTFEVKFSGKKSTGYTTTDSNVLQYAADIKDHPKGIIDDTYKVDAPTWCKI